MESNEKLRSKWQAARDLEMLRWTKKKVFRVYEGTPPKKPMKLRWTYQVKKKPGGIQLRARSVAKETLNTL